MCPNSTTPPPDNVDLKNVSFERKDTVLKGIREAVIFMALNYEPRIQDQHIDLRTRSARTPAIQMEWKGSGEQVWMKTQRMDELVFI